MEMETHGNFLVKISISGEDTKGFERSISVPVTTYSANTVAPDAVASNLSYGYSGRHDQGQLCELKEGGYYSDLIGSLQELKNDCESFMQTEITRQANESDRKKKPRIEE